MEISASDADVEELQRLLTLTERPRVQQALHAALAQLRAELPSGSGATDGSTAIVTNTADPTGLSEAATASAVISDKKDSLPVATETIPRPVKVGTAEPERAYTSLDGYAWDQTSSSVKVYITYEGIGSLPKDAVAALFGKQSLELKVHGERGKNQRLVVPHLSEPIDAKRATCNVRANRIVLTLPKANAKHWGSLAAKPEKFKTPDVSADPSKSLMDLMKNLYDDGDDEMKRTLAKAWHESQQKKASGLGADMDLPPL